MSQDLTNSEVIKFIEKVDSSFMEQDLSVLESTFSDNVILEGKTTAFGKVSDFKITKNEYMSSVASAWANYESYKYIKETYEIKLVENNRAVVEEVVVEEFSVNGSDYRVRSENEVTLEKTSGEVRAAKININSVMSRI